MTSSKVFIGIAISFAVGILIASAFDIPRLWLYLFLVFCLACFALSFSADNKLGLWGGLFLFALGLGALRLQISIVPNQYQDLFGSKQQMEGYIVEDVDVRPTEQFVTFRPDDLNQNIQITSALTQNFFYGDRIVVTGKIQEVKNFSDFDYQKYLERFNVYAAMDRPQILILKSHQLNRAKEILLRIKAAFIAKVSQLLPEPENSLLLGILLGDKSGLPKDIVSNFNLTGTSHIIAVSGYNITIIIIAVASLAYVLGRRPALWLGIITIISFVVITGASASVVRAAVMGFLLLIALNIGRQYSIVPALFFAGLAMLVINPKILYWDVGFQLSFAATLGIVYFLPVFEKLTAGWPEFFGGKVLILTTFSAIITTLPLIILNFGIFSLSAPIVNVLILPIIPATMLFGFLAVLPWLGPGLAFLANGLLFYIIKTTEFFANLPYSSLAFEIPLWMFWLLIVGVFVLYFSLKRLAEGKVSDRALNGQKG